MLYFSKAHENTFIAEGYLVGKTENYRGSTGKPVSVQPQRFRHWAQLLWTLEEAKEGTGAWHFLLPMSTGLHAVESKLKAKYNKGIWETNFKEVWDDAWDKQLLCMCSTHQSFRYIWDLSEKRESAASVSVDPQIPIAGVAEWPSSLDCIQGFVGLYHMTYMHVSPHGNEHVVHMYSCRKWGWLQKYQCST